MTNPHYEPGSRELAAAYNVPQERVDDAIDWALIKAAGEEGWPAVPMDMSPLLWLRIGSDVEAYLQNPYNLIDAA